jgi:hypothetical protein
VAEVAPEVVEHPACDARKLEVATDLESLEVDLMKGERKGLVEDCGQWSHTARCEDGGWSVRLAYT